MQKMSKACIGAQSAFAQPENDLSKALKPCPCCGGKAEFLKIDDLDSRNFGAEFIECHDCDLSTNLMFSHGEDCRPILAEKWDRRTTDELIAEAKGQIKWLDLDNDDLRQNIKHLDRYLSNLTAERELLKKENRMLQLKIADLCGVNMPQILIIKKDE